MASQLSSYLNSSLGLASSPAEMNKQANDATDLAAALRIDLYLVNANGPGPQGDIHVPETSSLIVWSLRLASCRRFAGKVRRLGVFSLA